MQKRKVCQQFYHAESIFRSDTLSLRLVDAVYHLSELDFALDEHLCLDDGWPTFQSKDFSAVPPQRAHGEDEISLGLPSESGPSFTMTRSMAESSDAGSVPVDPVLSSSELERLRAERAMLAKERDDAVRLDGLSLRK